MTVLDSPEVRLVAVLEGLRTRYPELPIEEFEAATRGEDNPPNLSIAYRFFSAEPGTIGGIRAMDATYVVVVFGRVRADARRLAGVAGLALDAEGWGVEFGEEARVTGTELSAWPLTATGS